MSFYDTQTWSQQGRQPSWEQQAPPPRSGATSSASNEPTAFMSQIEEVDKAMDDLTKSGKLFGGPGVPLGGNRRESMPSMNRGYPDDQRSGNVSRHHSIQHEHDGSRSGSAAGLQGFYASQRFQPQQPQQQPRQSEAEQMMQAKRRMAAQRERELRNYHQEQQYNRNASTSTSTVKPDRSSSPNTMNEDDRRELIARQHRALYGNEPAMYSPDGTAARQSQDSRLSVSGSVRGASPLAYDSFGAQSQSGAESAVQMPSRELAASVPDRRASTSPAVSNPPGFSMAETLHQTTRTAGSPSNNSPSIMQGAMPPQASTGVAPIGTRPSHSQNTTAKRSITPNTRSIPAASDKTPSNNAPGLGSWGTDSGVWGNMNTNKSVQASVWG